MPRMPRLRLLAAAAVAVALVLIAPAAAALSAPTLVGPPDGETVQALPAFGWNPVAGADHYEFEFSADTGFNSNLAAINTKNTRATLKTVVANGTYYWRVRAVTSAGALGPWSETRTLEMAWTARPSLLAPSNGATLSYPADPFKLSWTTVPGASKYLVKLATDPALGSLIWSNGLPVETAATTFTLSAPLGPGTYYWTITPVDAEGHPGNPSGVATFTWEWPSTTATTFTDLAADPELVDPQFSWNPVPGAAGYEVEVNSSSDWATGSKVCCDSLRFGSKISTIGTSLSPDVLLPNNTYYWRVRAVDVSENTGVWNVGPGFTKTFDSVPPVPAPSVKNLRMRDNVNDPGTDVDGAAPGYQTQVPILAWDPVPGASAYQVEVTPFLNGSCDWGAPGRWSSHTTSTAWSPLGTGWNGVAPFPRPASIAMATDSFTSLDLNTSYCARVRPRNRDASTTVYGDFTYLDDGTGASFKFTTYPTGGACSPSCKPGNLGSADYVLPIRGSTKGRMPLFTWKPLSGKQSYFVIVAKDPNFTTIEDYAFTQIPAYAPRQHSSLTTYADETTSYYWAVLPATNADGSGAVGDPLRAAPADFQKRSAPPTLLAPAEGATLNAPTMFRWSPTEGARRYHLQVSGDASFANLIDNVMTAATSYTSSTTYRADVTLYWRVRADADDDPTPVRLTWSATGTFRKELPRPVLDPNNPTSGAAIPTWTWAPVPGAISYDLHWTEADGDNKYVTDLPSHAFAFVKWTGVGILHWEVRANFPSRTATPADGPWSTPLQSFAHTIPEPTGAASEIGASRVLMSWNPRPGAKQYCVQVSNRPDFGTLVDGTTTTQTTSYAPLLKNMSYTNGGEFYWRVAAVDADLNVGDFTAPQTFSLPRLMRLSSFGYPRKGYYSTITITATDATRAPVPAARVCLSGAGISLRCKLTTSLGRAAFYVRATRYGKVYVKATKSGYQSASLTLSVR